MRIPDVLCSLHGQAHADNAKPADMAGFAGGISTVIQELQRLPLWLPELLLVLPMLLEPLVPELD